MKKICNKEDILTHLTAAMVEKKKVIVWTKSEDETEFYYSEAVITKINHGTEVKLELDQNIQCIENQAVHLAIKEDSFVMVSKINSLKDKKVFMTLPSMAVGKERRRSPRKRYKFEEKIEITVTVGNSHDLLTTHLLDLSKHGMCVVVTEESLHKIIKHKQIDINQSGDLHLQGKCEMKSLRLLSSATCNRSSLYSVGFEFI